MEACGFAPQSGLKCFLFKEANTNAYYVINQGTKFIQRKRQKTSKIAVSQIPA